MSATATIKIDMVITKPRKIWEDGYGSHISMDMEDTAIMAAGELAELKYTSWEKQPPPNYEVKHVGMWAKVEGLPQFVVDNLEPFHSACPSWDSCDLGYVYIPGPSTMDEYITELKRYIEAQSR